MSDDPSRIVREIIEHTGRDRTRLLDVARAVQERLGFVGEDSVKAIAAAMGLRPVEVRDALSFYSFLSLAPGAKTTIRLSTCESGRMKGSEDVERALKNETAAAGEQITVTHTSCIGMCDQSPAALVDGRVLTNLTAKDAKKIVDGLKKPADGYPSFVDRVESNVRHPGPVIFAPMEKGAAIRAALSMSPEEVIELIGKSRLRGRGGAGFPTAMKWSFCRKTPAKERFLLCNCDEGEPGTFKDRAILMEVPDLLFEGMTVAGYALGAKLGILYLRGEYKYLAERLTQALDRRRRLGLLGQAVCGREGFSFDIRIQLGAGAYVCGEESSLIESLEGKRGAPRDRPPYPVQRGYLNEPTTVNNAETLCAAARVMEKGAEWFTSMGTKDSTGTKLFSVSGDCERPGVYELEFGIVIDRLMETVGAGDVQAVQVGGPSGQCLAVKDLGKRICYEDVSTGGAVMVFDATRDVLGVVRDFTAFFVEESCGWCAPCRIGTSLLLKQMDRILGGKGTRADLRELESLGNTVKKMSRCGLGQTAANPVLTSLRNFPHLYDRLIVSLDFVPRLELDEAVREAVDFTGREPPGKEAQA
jgi:[NiFe] hydrogenase diaphorase moiety large subunit